MININNNKISAVANQKFIEFPLVSTPTDIETF